MEYSKGKMKIDFTKRIEEYKEKSDKETLAYLSDFWNVTPNEDGIIRLYASYQKCEHRDSKGNDFAFFTDVRNEMGDILYYPYKLGKVKIWSQYKTSFESQPIWQINVRLSEKKYRKENPFSLCMANNTVGKPSMKFNDRLEKESIIKKIFNDTGYTQRDAKNTVNALHNIMDDLYTNADDRFVYELLQNADDQPQEGKSVSVFMQLLENHLLFMHNGRPFDKDDVDSICSIGSSTKRNSKEKIGYKGIGFKSVFTGSDTVIVNSGNFSFAFDKYSPLYNDADIENTPWQLKPIWQEKYRYPQEVRSNEYFWKSQVGFSLDVDSNKVENYDYSIRKILSSPLFLLFLKNVSLFHFQYGATELKIEKNEDSNAIHIRENDKIISSWTKTDYVIEIPQDIRDAMQNDRNVPQKMKEATKTQISFAAIISGEQIGQIDNSVLYAYLPTTVNDFKFNFIVNADFLLAANREQLHTKKIWNRFLFQQIGKLLVEWSKSISALSPTYLSVLPKTELPEEETGHLALSSYFNNAYKSALESEAFILNHKGELAKKDEIIIDKTGLSGIVGAGLFCQLLGTDKCLPSEKIDSKILEEDIFEYIEAVKFDDVIETITNNSDFNDWFISAVEEQKKALYKWISDNDIKTRKDKLKLFVSNLPLFQFGEEYKSYKEIGSSEYIITTEHIKLITEILSKLGFICSDNVFDENHQLYAFVELQDEDDLFNSIKKCDFQELTADERRILFFSLANFDGVGKAKLKDIALFRNINYGAKPLGKMIAYRDNVPLWLSDYVLCKEDNDAVLSDYLISQKDEFENIIQEHIGEIAAPITELYKTYKNEWTGQFTRQIIDKYEIDNEILTIIEESDTQTKEYFLDNVKKLELHSTSTYKKDSYEYRVLQLALFVYDEPSDFSSKIYFDGQCIKDFSVSDDVVCEYTQNGKTKKVKMSLAKLLPQYQNQSDSIDKIKTLFETKKDLDKFFVAKPKPLSEVYSELNELLGIIHAKSSPWDSNSGNAYQYLFSVYKRKQVWSNLFGFQINLKAGTDEFVKELLCWLYDNDIQINTSPFTYHLKKYFIDKYFGSDYVFDEEQLLPIIENWADNEKKIKYLKDNGVQTSECNAIQFRKLFLENKPINFIDKLSDGDIKSGIEFVATTSGIEHPFVGVNQKNILLSLKDKCKDLSDNRDVRKMMENSKEWDTKEYKEWIEGHIPQIFIYPGILPSQLLYKDKILLNYDDSENDYYYNSQEKKLFVSNARKIEEILFEVAKEDKSDLSFDDYKFLCWDGKVSLTKEEKDDYDNLKEEKDKIKLALQKRGLNYDDLLKGDGSNEGIIIQEPIEGANAIFEEKSGQHTSEIINAESAINVLKEHGFEVYKPSQNLTRAQENYNDTYQGNLYTRDGVPIKDQIDIHKEAMSAAKKYLESKNFDFSKSDYERSSDEFDKYQKWRSACQIHNVFQKSDGKSVTVVVKSCKGGHVYLSATDFQALTENKDNILILYDNNGCHSVSYNDLFKGSDVNLIFDPEYTPEHYYAALGKIFTYIKRSTFAVKNPSYNAYDTIKSFGMDSKTEGVQELFDDNDL